jgi:polysaccharide biosynthesis/export protein
MISPRLNPLVCAYLAFIVALSCTSAVRAQDTRGGAPAVVPPAGSVPAENASPNAKVVAVPVQIAPGDLLEISVFDVPEMTQQVRVGADGKAQLALLGNYPLAGLTGQQAAEAIARELRDRNFLVRPQVNVLIKESTNQSVSIVGEVQHPGIYPIAGPRTVLDVISLAGGLTTYADTKLTVKHRSSDENSVTVALKNDDAKTSLAVDVQVYPGDLVVVPRAGIVYVLGEVARPGGFVMQDNGKITVLQALAQAGSARGNAAPNNAVLLHKVGDEYVSTPLHLAKISRGQEHDFELHANDIVFVPNSKLKDALHSTQSIATTVGTASIYALVH